MRRQELRARVAAGCVSLSALIGAAAPPPPLASPAQLLARAIAAAAAQRAFTWAQTASGPGAYRQVTVAGQVDGTSALVTGSAGPVGLTWDLIGSTVYFRGDAGTLTGALGFRTASANQEAGKWVAVPEAAGALFQELSSGLTVSSATQMLDLVGRLALVPATTLRGEAVVGIECSRLPVPETAVQTMYVRAQGAPLPVQLSNVQSGITSEIYFSGWAGPAGGSRTTERGKVPESVARRCLDFSA